jgi:protein involved in polysaccharide export with SLBB domain
MLKCFLTIACLAGFTPCFAQLDYMLKPVENILIRAPQNPKIDGHIFQIQADGFVTLPSVGRLHAGGVTLQAFQKSVASRLSQGSVEVTVVAFRSPKPTRQSR